MEIQGWLLTVSNARRKFRGIRYFIHPLSTRIRDTLKDDTLLCYKEI